MLGEKQQHCLASSMPAFSVQKEPGNYSDLLDRCWSCCCTKFWPENPSACQASVALKMLQERFPQQESCTRSIHAFQQHASTNGCSSPTDPEQHTGLHVKGYALGLSVLKLAQVWACQPKPARGIMAHTSSTFDPSSIKPTLCIP